MITYFIKKITYSALVLWGVITVVFFLFNILPGDPARMMLDKREDSKQLLVIKHKYGFDRNPLEQYLLYINDLSPISFHYHHRDSFTSLSKGKYTFFQLYRSSKGSIVLKYPYLRDSFVRHDCSVTSIISSTFINTLVLAIASMAFALIFGLLFGVIAALYKDSMADKIVLLISALGMSLPSFFMSILIAWFFGFLLHTYTGLSMTGSLFEVDDYGRGYFLQVRNLILPALTLGVRPLSVVVQLTRSSLLDVLSMDYVRTATAKGLSKYIVIFRHALRNALNPVVTAVSGWLASLLAGAVFVEYIFAWNGIGKEIVDSLNMMDLPVIMGLVLFVASIFILINIIVDLIYMWLDPRIRIE